MNILAEIYRTSRVDIHGRTIGRTAVRGVILRDRDLLMIYSSNVGDYKFPGGGVNAGESHFQALQREIEEESGLTLVCIEGEIGAVVEYNIPLEKEYDVFKMTSYYYQCSVKNGAGVQKLDAYEQELGFVPVWIDMDRALQANQMLLDSAVATAWLRREIFMLDYLKQYVFK
jgi:8-oxo-dGTP pyrophosphatase MutT (NUDIX family)